MHITQRKQEYSYAYIQALAAVAGFSHAKPSVDDDSIDFTISASRSRISGAPRLDMQFKCTETVPAEIRESFSFDLSLKNYNDLRAECSSPRILVVILVPRELDEWITHSEESLNLSRCAYWLSLAGQPDVTNRSNVRVTIPRNQVLSVTSLNEMMERSARGESI